MSKILAYMRKWAFDGETPQKERKGNGRLAWPFRFKLHPVTLNRCLADDIALVSKEEIDRLTRELAEAKARAGSAIASLPDGWVAVPVEPVTGENYDKGLWSRRNWTAALEDMLSARPDPKEPSNVE